MNRGVPLGVRVPVAGALLALTVSGATAIALSGVGGGSVAVAADSTYRVIFHGNTGVGNALETRASGRFVCNRSTGHWYLIMSNLQVISDDGVTPWDRANFGGTEDQYWVYVQLGSEQFQVVLSQASNELFVADGFGTLSSASDCSVGAVVTVSGGIAAHSYEDYEASGQLRLY